MEDAVDVIVRLATLGREGPSRHRRGEPPGSSPGDGTRRARCFERAAAASGSGCEFLQAGTGLPPGEGSASTVLRVNSVGHRNDDPMLTDMKRRTEVAPAAAPATYTISWSRGGASRAQSATAAGRRSPSSTARRAVPSTGRVASWWPQRATACAISAGLDHDGRRFGGGGLRRRQRPHRCSDREPNGVAIDLAGAILIADRTNDGFGVSTGRHDLDDRRGGLRLPSEENVAALESTLQFRSMWPSITRATSSSPTRQPRDPTRRSRRDDHHRRPAWPGPPGSPATAGRYEACSTCRQA